jgi:Domain of unknown function (DUF5011)
LLTACSGGSSDPTVVSGDFTAYGVKGTVSGQNVTLDLSGLGNCATNIENMVIGINANGASISPDPRVARDYSQPVQFTLTAPDGTKAVYTVTVKGAACVTAPPPPPPTPDTTPPVITVLGANPLSLTVGTAYTEAGATCVDNKDPSCTVVTTGTVNTAAEGTYTITYTATDAAGNASSKTRNVNMATTTPTSPALADVGPLSDAGGFLSISFNLNALLGLPTDSAVIGVTGFPLMDYVGGATNFAFDAFGNCTVLYDAGGLTGDFETVPVTVEVRVPGFTNTLKRPLNIIIRNDG